MTIAVFNAKAPGIMRKLMKDFALDVESAAAILGNLGHESGGLTSLQEISPTVAGSRGGYGWPQWTGPRRRAYEAYCARNHLSPSSDAANYAYMFVELSGDYKNAIAAVKKPGTLRQKVERFELIYEGAGIKGYASRETWAKRALSAYQAAPEEPAPEAPKPPPVKPQATATQPPPAPAKKPWWKFWA